MLFSQSDLGCDCNTLLCITENTFSYMPTGINFVSCNYPTDCGFASDVTAERAVTRMVIKHGRAVERSWFIRDVCLS
jgi:hypothetical protein